MSYNKFTPRKSSRVNSSANSRATSNESGPQLNDRNKPPMNNKFNKPVSQEQSPDQKNQPWRQRKPQQEFQQQPQIKPKIQTQQERPLPPQPPEPIPEQKLQVPKDEPHIPEEKPQQQPEQQPQQQPQAVLPQTPESAMCTEVKSEPIDCDASKSLRPFWMKTKLQGVKKITNRERRRRQNETLRRLLAPKNALMVLNEMRPGEAITNQFKVEQVGDLGSYSRTTHAFQAELKLESKVYKGYGETKMAARNAVAEQAIRDLIIERMSRVMQETEKQDGNATETTMETEAEGESEGESMPMIQLASFALHKLFAEWECGGHRVPHLKTTANGEPSAEFPAPARKARALPERAAVMHPCMLLTYMRPQLAYQELPPEGTRPPDMLFGVAVNVDGQTFYGKACSKKEARRMAAREACEQIFGVEFETLPAPSHKT